MSGVKGIIIIIESYIELHRIEMTALYLSVQRLACIAGEAL